MSTEIIVNVVLLCTKQGAGALMLLHPNTPIKGNVPQLIASSHNRTLAFLDKNGNRPTEQIATGTSRKGLISSVESIIGKKPGRYQISVGWSGGGGHRFCAEHTADGKIFIYDPQSGKKYTSLTEYFAGNSIAVKRGIGVLKIDELLFNTQYIDKILI